MKYREVYYDGCNGARLGKIVEAEPDENGDVVLDDCEYSSRNDDGLLENEGGDVLLVPCEVTK